MIIVIRFGLFILALGYKLLSRLGVIKTKGQTQLGAFTYGVSRYRNGVIKNFQIFGQTKAKVFLKIGVETKWLKFCKKMGWGNDLQLGDFQIDDLFYVASDHPILNRELTNNKEFIESLKGLALVGLKSFSLDGQGNILVEGIFSEEPQRLEFLKEHLEKMLRWFDDKAHSLYLQDPFYLKFLFLEALIFAVGSYGFLGIIFHRLGLNPMYLDGGDFIFMGLKFGALFLASWFAAAFHLLKNSSRFGLLLGDSLLAIIFSIYSGLQIASDININFDRSEAIAREAIILERKQTSSRSSRSRVSSSNTQTHIRVQFKDNPNNTSEWITLSTWSPWGLSEGDGVRLWIKKGFFGASYIDDLEEIPPPATLSQKNESSPRKDLVEWLPPADETSNSSMPENWFEEKYRHGKFRTREPVVQGQRQGEASYWHENGQLYSKIFWRNNQKHGRFQLFREDGSLEQVLTYKDGQPHGLSRWYSPQGEMTHFAIYENGKVIEAGTPELKKMIEEIK